jgi:hypothetical protein
LRTGVEEERGEHKCIQGFGGEMSRTDIPLGRIRCDGRIILT